ncbi:adenylate/guanylate cyclase domain-containing protein [Longimicrobium sp.]|uniref:CHASE2 domain-containing protein n=1 Tax=Longimicrobium sp. TaxID=2029185 RepID=UPI002D0ABC1A|nr:adenylate/guanylate cyclase domain-containing protein [Longimicrobium sp.]HSU15744.1 adenylate/guanylate cyclase domain-containing protein [Longimicrobium sp.]
MADPQLRSKRLRRLGRGAAVGLATSVLVLALRGTSLMRQSEGAVYDAMTRTLADPSRASKDIVIAAIDDRSLAELAPSVGRWPWPRSAHAEALRFLNYAGAKLVVYDVQFPEADLDAASDSDFAEAMAEAGNAVLPMALAPERPSSEGVRAGASGEAETERFALRVRGRLRPAEQAFELAPTPLLARGAAGIGSIALNQGAVGATVRHERLVWRHGGRLYPSLAYAAARLADSARYGGPLVLGADRLAARERPDGRGTAVPLDAGEMLLRWRGPFARQTYPVYSYSRLVLSYEDVFHGRPPAIPPAELKGKIVLVAVTSSGLYDLRRTPFGGTEPGVMIHATALDNLLRGDFMRRADASWNWLGVVAAAMATAIAVAVVGSAVWGTLAAGLLLLFAVGASALAFAGGVWLDAAAPALGGALAYAGAMAMNYVTEGRERRRVRDMFSRFVDPHVVGRLADAGESLKLGGQRVPLTILFSDIRGFTSLSERLPAETVVATLNEYLGAMTDIVFRHGGTIDKFIGDAVMAFWGAPLPAADHARRAADCALEMIETLERLNRGWAADGRGAGLAIGIGINTGEAVVGMIGSLKHKLDYTAIGDAVNLASRLESLNKDMGTTIIISDAVRTYLGDGYDAAPLREVHVKGKEQAVLVHELKGRRRAAPATLPGAAKAVVTAGLAALLLALAPHDAAAQGKQRWTDRVYQPGRWQRGQLVAMSVTNPAAADSLALVAQVEGYAKAPRWRAEVRRVGANGQLGEPLVLVAERNRVQVVTGVAAAPLEQNAAKDDPLVQAVVAQFDAAGALRQPGAGRIVQRAAGKVARVMVRRPALQSDFPDALLAMSRGRRTMNDLVQRTTGNVAANRTASLAPTAGARGVTVQTPSGSINVTPDPAAVAAMDRRTTDAVAIDDFVRQGHLEQPVPVKEDTQ